MLIRPAIAALLALSAGCAPPPPPPAPPAPPPMPTPSPTAAPAPLDLATEDAARKTILEVLKRGDKEAFRRCVSSRMLDKKKDGFDAWYEVWHDAAEKMPASFSKIRVTNENGAWKLDEN